MDLDDPKTMIALRELGRRLVEHKRAGGESAPQDERVPRKLRAGLERVVDLGLRLVARRSWTSAALCDELVERGAPLGLARAAVSALLVDPVTATSPEVQALRLAARVLIDGRGSPASRASLTSTGMPPAQQDELNRALERVIPLLIQGAEPDRALDQLVREGVRPPIAMAAVREVHEQMAAAHAGQAEDEGAVDFDALCESGRRLLRTKLPPDDLRAHDPGADLAPGEPEPVPQELRDALEAVLDRGLRILAKREPTPQELCDALVERGAPMELAEVAVNVLLFVPVDPRVAAQAQRERAARRPPRAARSALAERRRRVARR